MSSSTNQCIPDSFLEKQRTRQEMAIPQREGEVASEAWNIPSGGREGAWSGDAGHCHSRSDCTAIAHIQGPEEKLRMSLVLDLTPHLGDTWVLLIRLLTPPESV